MTMTSEPCRWTFDGFAAEIRGDAARIADVVVAKQTDYGPKAILLAPFSPDHGLLTRVFDKIYRLENLLARDSEAQPAVEESIDDTLADIAGYVLLWRAYRAGTLDYDPETA